jgi:carbohydrate kinase (thermoresistant glucokinase family)
MGVSGCGKSTVAGLLAGRLGCDLAEGDDLHPPQNVAKMSAGVPLTDADRMPWLRSVAAWIADHVDNARDGVITCSALKRSYRDLLRGSSGDVVFVYLHGTKDVIAHRLAGRHGHYMPPSLLDSQFADLEPPQPDERALTIDIGPSPSTLVDEVTTTLHLVRNEPRHADMDDRSAPDEGQVMGADDSSHDTKPV